QQLPPPGLVAGTGRCRSRRHARGRYRRRFPAAGRWSRHGGRRDQVMRQLLRHKVSAGVLALAGTWTPAAAQDGPPSLGPVREDPIIVLESYVGQRPANANAIMAPLLDELEQHGFAAHPASVLELVGGRAPRPGVLDKDTTAAEITQPAESGYEAYTRGRFAEAEAALKLAIARIHRNPALLVLDTNNLEA